MPPFSNSIRKLSTQIRQLRSGFIVRRFLELVTVALVANICLDLLAYLSAIFLKKNFHIPFFAGTIFTVLLVREAFRMKDQGFTLFLDRTFHLKDRLYSFTTFIIQKEKIRPEIIEAHAAECLTGIDFKSMKNRLKPRIPPLFFLVMPLFLIQIYIYLNAGYIPPGGLSSTAVRIVNSQTDRFPKTGGDHAFDTRKSGTGSDGTKKAENSTVNLASGKTDGPEESKVISPSERSEALSQSNEPSGGQDKSGHPDETGVSGSETVSEPGRKTESVPVSENVSLTGEANLSDTPDFDPEKFADPTHLLSLLPKYEGRGIQTELSLADVMGAKLEDYPVRFRKHIKNYYEDLISWQQSQKIDSLKN